MTFFLIVFGAVIGACIGSFAGCVAYRLPRRLSLSGRSFCPACTQQVPAWRNLPVVAFLLQRGRAACCGVELRGSYLWLELGGALTGAVVAALLGHQVLLFLALAVAAGAQIASWVTRRATTSR